MKHVLAIATLLFSFYYSSGQKTYSDFLNTYRKQYIADLYPVIKSDTAYIDFYPPDESMLVKAEVAILPGEKPFLLMTSSGKTKEAKKYAKLTFILSGQEYALYAYQLLKLKDKEATSTLLFIPFTDETCGETSYGGGRYIDLDARDIRNNSIIIDFNKAYNPYCAFTTGYNCPIPPRENALPVAIKAGEQYHADRFIH